MVNTESPEEASTALMTMIALLAAIEPEDTAEQILNRIKNGIANQTEDMMAAGPAHKREAANILATAKTEYPAAFLALVNHIKES